MPSTAAVVVSALLCALLGCAVKSGLADSFDRRARGGEVLRCFWALFPSVLNAASRRGGGGCRARRSKGCDPHSLGWGFLPRAFVDSVFSRPFLALYGGQLFRALFSCWSVCALQAPVTDPHCVRSVEAMQILVSSVVCSVLRTRLFSRFVRANHPLLVLRMRFRRHT